MSDNSPTPWKQGFVLKTSTTKRWSSDELEATNAFERRRIFSNFHGMDEGRSRKLVATCESEDDARRIVACVNACQGVDTETLEQSPDLASAFMSANNAKLIQQNRALVSAMKKIIAISDRKHDAWDEGKAAIAASEASGE